MKNKIKKLKFDCCNYLQNLKDVIIETERKVKIEGQEIDVTYFACPKCGKIYLGEIVDNKAAGYKVLFRIKLDSLGKTKDQSKKPKILKDLNELRLEQKAYQDSLKNKYEKSFYLEKGIGTTTLKWKGENEK